jgi:exo-1,4-beta-D-glucosaminidase
LTVRSGGTAQAMTLPRLARDARVYFVRCELLDRTGEVITENVYWQSQRKDDVGDPNADFAFELRQESWADMTPLNTMARVPLDVTAQRRVNGAGQSVVSINLANPTTRVAFFQRAEVTATRDGDEILPIQYSDNYVTVFPGETVELEAVVPSPLVTANWVRVSGYNSAPVEVRVS